MALDALPAATGSEQPKNTVTAALLALSSVDQDHAAYENGVGFNGTDTRFMNSLADQVKAGRPLTYRQSHVAWRELKKYYRQLERAWGIDYFAIPEPSPKDFEPTSLAELHPSQNAQPRVLDVGHQGELTWTFPFKREVYLAIKNLKGSHWDSAASKGFEKTIWRLNFHADQAEQIVQVAEASGFTITEAARQLIGKVGEEAQAAIAAATAESAEPIPGLLEICKMTPRPYQWAAVHYALSQDLRVLIGDDMGLGKSVEAELIAEALDQMARAADPEKGTAYPILIICPNNVKPKWAHEIHKLFPHRRAYVVNGSEALPGLFRADFYISNWEGLSEGYDKTVPNREVVVWKLPIRQLVNRGLRGLIFDESQNAKNPGAQRTKAARQLTDAVVRYCEEKKVKPLLLNLTGTPVMNRPRELAPQLELIRRLDDFGGYWQFVSRYAKFTTSLSGSEIPDTGPLKELHDRLLMTCMIRRTKTQVAKDLPELLPNAEMPMEIGNRAEYSKAAADAAKWFAEQAAADEYFLGSIAGLPEEDRQAAIKLRMTSQYIKTRRGEVLARIRALKTISERGRRQQCIDWCQEFLQETGKKLIVFAESRESQFAFVEHFKEYSPALLLGGMPNDARFKENTRFLEDPTCRLAICSLKAANAGVDLYSASDVYHHELGWNPAIHDQATARAHRIGQTEAVTPWFAYGDDTIEADIYDLIWNQKATIVGAIHDGSSREEVAQRLQTGSLLGDLIERLTKGRVKRTVINGGVDVKELKAQLAGDAVEEVYTDPFADVVDGDFTEFSQGEGAEDEQAARALVERMVELQALPAPNEGPVQSSLDGFDLLFADDDETGSTEDTPVPVAVSEDADPAVAAAPPQDPEFEVLSALEVEEDGYAF